MKPAEQTAEEKTPPKWKKTLKALLIAAALYVLLSALASQILFSALFGRAEPDPAPDLLPQDLSVTWKETEFLSGEANLFGILLYPEGEAKGAVILAPGMNSGAFAHLAEAQAFARAGYFAFTYDPTGTGRSGGESVKGLSQGKFDLLAAADFLRRVPETQDLSFILYGHSAGGYAAAAASDEIEGVSCVIAAAAFDDPVDLMLRTARGYVWILADLEYPFLLLQNRFVFGEGGNEKAHEELKESGVPVLIVRTREDERVPAEASLFRYADRVPGCAVLDAPREGHSLFWLSDDAAAYRRALPEKNAYSEEERMRASAIDEAYFSAILNFLGKN